MTILEQLKEEFAKNVDLATTLIKLGEANIGSGDNQGKKMFATDMFLTLININPELKVKLLDFQAAAMVAKTAFDFIQDTFEIGKYGKTIAQQEAELKAEAEAFALANPVPVPTEAV